MNEDKKDKEINIYKENYLLESVFVKDTEFQYILKKTEKIVTAIYLVTNFLTPEEPLKWSLRNATNNLLKNTMTFSKTSLSDREIRIHEINSTIFETASLFDLAFRSGFISIMNYEIINYEISKLAVSLSEYKTNMLSSNKGLFDDKYFEVHKNNNDFNLNKTDFNKENLKGQKTDDFNKRPIEKDSENNNDLYKNNIYKADSLNYSKKDNLSYKGQNSKNNKPNNKKTNVERRNIIIGEIRNRKEVSIKEISNVLPNLSNKTIQRELLSMVDDGLLIKKGERRWSRYSLKN